MGGKWWGKTVENNREIGHVARKEGTHRREHWTNRRMILSQEDQPGAHPTPADIASEPNIDCWSVSRDLGFYPLTKCKVRKFTDLNLEKHMHHLRKLLSSFTQKTLQTAFFSDEKIFKVEKLYKSHPYNDVVYVLKKIRKVAVP